MMWAPQESTASHRWRKPMAVNGETEPRVWDRFLSEKDKAAIAFGQPRTRGYEHLQKLAARARAAGIPVIHPTGVSDDGVRPWAKGARATRNQVNDEAAADR